MSFRYPNHPNTNRTDPFRDADGKNPFGDEESPLEKADANPYSASLASEPVPQPPDSYQIRYPHRGRTVYWLGFVGCCCACGAVLAAAGFLATPSDTTGLLVLLSLLLLLVSLTSGGTAWKFGREDLRAIRSGAMDSAGVNPTQRGHLLGIVATLISIGTLAGLAAASVVQ